ncbi:MAG TPA: hypothetical protein VNM90_23090, partial [Haliangium sp.]|nr:hypothetical protein [Haliangium sp.]
LRAYRRCVEKALDELIEAGVIEGKMRCSLLSSALRAYREARADERPGQHARRPQRPCHGQTPGQTPCRHECRPHRPCNSQTPDQHECRPKRPCHGQTHCQAHGRHECRPKRPCDDERPGRRTCSPRGHGSCDGEDRRGWGSSEAL